MTKYLLTFFFMVLCTLTKGQNVSIDELISLRAKSLGSVEEFLTTRKWEMLKVDSSGRVSFAYKKNEYNDTALAFISYDFSEQQQAYWNNIRLQIHLIATYNVYLARLKALGYTVKKSFIKDGKIVKFYRTNVANGTTVNVTIDKNSDNIIYQFHVWNSTLHEVIFAE